MYYASLIAWKIYTEVKLEWTWTDKWPCTENQDTNDPGEQLNQDLALNDSDENA